jgi:hypothetical protein
MARELLAVANSNTLPMANDLTEHEPYPLQHILGHDRLRPIKRHWSGLLECDKYRNQGAARIKTPEGFSNNGAESPRGVACLHCVTWRRRRC